MWQAMKYCQQKGFDKVIFEINSLSLKHMVIGFWTIPQDIEDKVEEIRDYIKSGNFQITHIFREANQLEDLIINIAINQEKKVQFFSFLQLPTTTKKVLNNDKYQLPYFIRIRTRRIHGY